MYSSVFDTLGFRKEKDKSRGNIGREEGIVYRHITEDTNRMESDDYFYEDGSIYETQAVPPQPPGGAGGGSAANSVNRAAVDGRGGKYSQQEHRDWQQLQQQRNSQKHVNSSSNISNHNHNHRSSSGWGSHNNDGQYHNDANSNAASKRRIVTVMGYCDMIEGGGNGGVPIGRVPFAAGGNSTGTGTGHHMDVHTTSRHFRFKRQKKTCDSNEDIEDRNMHEQLNSRSLQLGRSEAFANKCDKSSNRSTSATTLHKYTMPNSYTGNNYHQNSNYQHLDGIFVAPPPNPNPPQHPPNTPLPLSFGSAFASPTAAPTVSMTSGRAATTTTASIHSSSSTTSTPAFREFSSYANDEHGNSSRRWCPGSGEEWDPVCGVGGVRAGGNGCGVSDEHHDGDFSMHVDDDDDYPSYKFDDDRQR